MSFPVKGELPPDRSEGPARADDVSRFRVSAAMFDQYCSGAVDTSTMAVLRESQHSHRRLTLRALVDQLAANTGAAGSLVEPEQAWRTLAAAEERDPAAVADILLYPTVGVWLTRALHYTRPDRFDRPSWPELGYLHLIAAAAAVRCGLRRTIRVPVWHGAVSLPTVGQFRLPGQFPVGTAEMICAGTASRLQVRGSDLADLSSPLFSRAQRYVAQSRGLTLSAWLEDRDPYRGFGDPRPPFAFDDVKLAEWRKFVDEAWDVLTRYHPTSARELAGGVHALVPIDPRSEVIGSSSPAAFGAIGLSGTDSAAELAEAMVHEFEHSKLNALMALVELADGNGALYCYAPWRDDPRAILGVTHGVASFTAGVEFWIRQRHTLAGTSLREAEFAIGLRRRQVRLAASFLSGSGRLNVLGRILLDALSHRLSVCEQQQIAPDISEITSQIVDDHRAVWRLKFVRPDPALVDGLARAWITGTAPRRPIGPGHVAPDDGRPLPRNRRNLLRAKALAPDLFESLRRRPESLPSTTSLADVKLCEGDNQAAATLYQDRLRANPSESQAWAGLGLALRGQADIRASLVLLENPEVVVAAYNRIRLLGGQQPDPDEFARWAGSAL